MGAPTSTRQQAPSSAPAHVHEGTIAIPVPLGPSRIATITVPTDMSDADWKRLDRILEAYRPDVNGMASCCQTFSGPSS